MNRPTDSVNLGEEAWPECGDNLILAQEHEEWLANKRREKERADRLRLRVEIERRGLDGIEWM